MKTYRVLIRSKLDYGSIVYGPTRPSYIKRLDTVHNQGLRLSFGAFRTSPVHSLYVEANESCPLSELTKQITPRTCNSSPVI